MKSLFGLIQLNCSTSDPPDDRNLISEFGSTHEKLDAWLRPNAPINVNPVRGGGGSAGKGRGFDAWD